MHTKKYLYRVVDRRADKRYADAAFRARISLYERMLVLGFVRIEVLWLLCMVCLTSND
jgi:hypothetical protein